MAAALIETGLEDRGRCKRELQISISKVFHALLRVAFSAWFVEGKFDCYAQHWIAHRKIFCGFSALRLAPDISGVRASHLANDSGRSVLPASQPHSAL